MSELERDPAQLEQLHSKLRAGQFTGDVFQLLHSFGEANYQDAKPTVETYLTNPDPHLRYMAISVLTFHWGCEEHRSTCETMAFEDPDAYVRSVAIGGLGSLMSSSQNPYVLRLLLRLFKNPREGPLIKRSAYSAMAAVMGRPQETISSERNGDIDSDLVSEAERLSE